MDRLGTHNQKTGISVNALRLLGMLFLAAGIIGRGVFQNHILGFTGMNVRQMLESIQISETTLNYAALSIALQVIETCAGPIFAMLLVEGVRHTSDFNKYFARVLGISLLTEIPYNLAMGRGVLDFSSRNPMFSLVLGMLLLFFYQRYAGKDARNMAMKLLLTAAALAWVKMLNIHYGTPMLVLILVLWALRNKSRRNLLGAGAALACGLLSPCFLASPAAFLAIRMCNGDREQESRAVNYLMYPGLLLLGYIFGKYLL